MGLVQLILFSMGLTAILYGAKAQNLKFGDCLNIQNVDYVDYERLNGTWYEFGRTPRADEDNGRCNTYRFGLPVEGMHPIKRLQIENNFGMEYDKVVEGNSTITGSGRGVTADGFSYTYLAFEYDKYLVTYACKKDFLGKYEIIWLLTRERSPPCEVILKAYDIVWDNKLSLDEMKKINQTDCPDTWDENKNFVEYLFKTRG